MSGDRIKCEGKKEQNRNYHVSWDTVKPFLFSCYPLHSSLFLSPLLPSSLFFTSSSQVNQVMSRTNETLQVIVENTLSLIRLFARKCATRITTTVLLTHFASAGDFRKKHGHRKTGSRVRLKLNFQTEVKKDSYWRFFIEEWVGERDMEKDVQDGDWSTITGCYKSFILEFISFSVVLFTISLFSSHSNHIPFIRGM